MFHLTSLIKRWDTPRMHRGIHEISARRRAVCHCPVLCPVCLKLIPTAAANYE